MSISMRQRAQQRTISSGYSWRGRKLELCTICAGNSASIASYNRGLPNAAKKGRCMAKSHRPAVKALHPVTIPKGNIRYAPGVRAGRWIFATGHKGTTDYVSGMSADVLSAATPRRDGPKLKREAEQIFKNVGSVFKAGGGDLRNIVR